MATYFHGGSQDMMHPDGLQTLLLMNPGYSAYPAEAAAPAFFQNPAFNSLNAHCISRDTDQRRQHQHLVGGPLQATPKSAQEVSAVPGIYPRVHYEAPQPQQGLSLSLSPHQQQQNYAVYRLESAEIPRVIPQDAREEARLPGAEAAMSSDLQSMQGVLMGSKYLNATQQLLEEVVNVGNQLKDGSRKAPKKPNREVDGGGGGDDGDATGGKPAAELTVGERQELQMKKAKLVHLLDEVEQRYKQYEHQMRAVVSSFESIAGVRSARTYTALALRTISRQFRCLKDAICGQIRAASKSLGEEECPWRSGGIGSRLRLVDHQLRQQRALEQLGMMQHNAWRPQRGLPERSVSVLRTWLFEHFLHPYPKDSDKLMLAKRTGLTRNQVSNWFINARVRLWKPMVEEMYMEEIKDREPANDGGAASPRNVDPNEDDDSPSKSTAAPRLETPTMETDHSNGPNNKLQDQHRSPPPIIQRGAEDNMTMQEPSMKKPRSCDPSPAFNSMALPMSMEMEVKPQEGNHSDLFAGFGDGGYNLNLLTSGAYPIAEIGGFQANGVSLTLGLQGPGGGQPSYLNDSYVIGRRFGMAAEANDQYCNLNNGSNPTVTSAYDGIGIQNRKGFAAQLLPDFVA